MAYLNGRLGVTVTPGHTNQHGRVWSTPTATMAALEPYNPLPGCGASHLRRGMNAVLRAVTGGAALYITPDTRLSSNILINLKPGQQASIQGGPHCVRGALLRPVVTDAGLSGWVVETEGAVFFVEPAPGE
jgi:hypothetical protein